MILRLATYAMGTRFELVLVGDDEPSLRAAGEEALREIEDCDRRLSLFRSDSLLSHLNRAAAEDWIEVDTDTSELLTLCATVYSDSAGVFDPTVGPLMRARGFRGASAVTQTAFSAVGFDAVLIDNGRSAVRFARSGIELDLGGIAKGHGLDLAARALRDAGVACAFLHGGTSSAVALGPPPGEVGWRVALADGVDAPVATLAHASLAVSAPAGRTVECDGRTIGHLLDPRTGKDARRIERAAVVAGSAALADAWSTALVVAGGELAMRDDAAALFATEHGGGLRWHRAPAGDGARFEDVFTVPEPMTTETA